MLFNIFRPKSNSLITDEINSFEKGICQLLENKLSVSDKKLLDTLLNDSVSENLYPLIKLKKFIHEDKPGKIKESLITFLKIKNYFTKLEAVINTLNLPNDTFKHYGLWLNKATKFQILQLQNPYIRYLHLLSFIHYQFHLWQDAYAFILMNVMNSFTKRAKKTYEDASKTPTQDNENQEDIDDNELDSDAQPPEIKEKKLWVKTFEIIRNKSLSHLEKLVYIEELADEYEKNIKTVSEVQDLNVENIEAAPAPKLQEKNYYDYLDGYSDKIRNRVAGIIKVLNFDEENSDINLMNAIKNYQKYDQIIHAETYTTLLNDTEKDSLIDDKNRFRIRLCKTLFFEKVADGVKTGVLNLKHSYKYLAANEYLIDFERWEKDKDTLIEQAGLTAFKSADKVLGNLKQMLNQQFEITHKNFLSGKNKHLKFDKDGKPNAKTPPTATKYNKRMSELFEECHYVLLPHILSDIEETTGFLNCFEHLNVKHKRKKPNMKVFLAAIIGYGCNLGIGKMGKITKGVKGHSISNTINWYFSLENVLKANDKLADMIDKLALSDVFRKNTLVKFSSSDGQKFNVAIPSLQATFSVKYFGTGKGVSVYSFINDKYALFYNTVFSSSEREAPYVIDGLLHNEIGSLEGEKEDGLEQKWMHTTDTHGFTETIFGATHLLGFSFAPRIKNYKKQQIYGFEKPSYYKEKGYFWLPKRSIDIELIKEQWDNILRLIATIRLKEVAASTIFRRLNSYAKQHPLYKALKEFGRIIKTIYLGASQIVASSNF